jgi:hypothetical protein
MTQDADPTAPDLLSTGIEGLDDILHDGAVGAAASS